MPNTHVQAAAEGLPQINRRNFLLHTAAAGAVATTVAPVIAEAKSTSPRERYDHHLAELKKAALELDPRIRFSQCSDNLGDSDANMGVVIMGQWATGFYDGDGIYAGGSKWSRAGRFHVKMLKRAVDGERGFSLIQVGEKDRRKWMEISESSLEAFIGKRVDLPEGGAA